MSNKKYEARVQKIAEEMAKAWENENIEFVDDEHYESVAKEYIPAARLAMRYMAEEHARGIYIGHKEVGHEIEENGGLKVFIPLSQAEHGLIPEPESKS